jgi:hypothetical protein
MQKRKVLIAVMVVAILVALYLVFRPSIEWAYTDIR